MQKGTNSTKGVIVAVEAKHSILEIDQVNQYMESNSLVPKKKHGFRAKRSTRTAWSDIQQDWAMKTENKEITGVLLWTFLLYLTPWTMRSCAENRKYMDLTVTQ